MRRGTGIHCPDYAHVYDVYVRAHSVCVRVRVCVCVCVFASASTSASQWPRRHHVTGCARYAPSPESSVPKQQARDAEPPHTPRSMRASVTIAITNALGDGGVKCPRES